MLRIRQGVDIILKTHICITQYTEFMRNYFTLHRTLVTLDQLYSWVKSLPTLATPPPMQAVCQPTHTVSAAHLQLQCLQLLSLTPSSCASANCNPQLTALTTHQNWYICPNASAFDRFSVHWRLILIFVFPFIHLSKQWRLWATTTLQKSTTEEMDEYISLGTCICSQIESVQSRSYFLWLKKQLPHSSQSRCLSLRKQKKPVWGKWHLPEGL